MEIKVYATRKKSIWIFVDGKHKKSIPKKYYSVLRSFPILEQLDFSKKRLSTAEKKLFSDKYVQPDIKSWLLHLEHNENNLFKLIKDHNIISVRKVFTHSKKRYEAIFSNGLKVKTTYNIYSNFEPKEPSVHLNY